MKRIKTRHRAAHNIVITSSSSSDSSLSENSNNKNSYKRKFKRHVKKFKEQLAQKTESVREKGGGLDESENRLHTLYNRYFNYDKVLRKMEQGLTSMSRIQENVDLFALRPGEIPAISPLELKEYMENHRVITREDEEESSFNDDGIRPSEEDFFSSDYVESDVSDYIPPLTRTKKAILAQLPTFEEKGTKEMKAYPRTIVIQQYHDMLLKKRIFKSYKALKYVLNMKVSPHMEAVLLREFEIRNKKLTCPFYYERDEPPTYKRLLKKRLNAITRKFELYYLDPVFRHEYIKRINNRVKYAILELKKKKEEWEMEREAQKRIDEEIRKLEEEQKKQKEEEEKQEISSFYDDNVPESEREFFSSDWDCDEFPRPMPESRTLARYYDLLAKYGEDPKDPPKKENAKRLKRLEIKAQFENYCHRKRTMKKLARFKTVDLYKDMYSLDPYWEGHKLMQLELHDKKLRRGYYYTKDESPVFKHLLFMRIDAILKKQNKYTLDENYRKRQRDSVLVEMMKVKDSPLFDNMFLKKIEDKDETESEEEEEEDNSSEWEDEEEEESSSLNDTEVPSTEAEFMSQDSLIRIKKPEIFRRPMTRHRKALYDRLALFEINVKVDNKTTINAKRKARLSTIEKFYYFLYLRQKEKGLKRLREIKKLGTNNLQTIAQELMNLELRDKKLHKKFYYMPNEDRNFKLFMQKRKRAIRRKCEKFAIDENFRKELEERYKNRKFKKIPMNESKASEDTKSAEKTTQEAITSPKPMDTSAASECVSLDRTDPGLWDKFEEDSFEYGPFHPNSWYENMSLPHFDDRKKERRRDYKLQNVIPRRDSAPGKCCIPMDDDQNNLSMQYGVSNKFRKLRYQLNHLKHVPRYSEGKSDDSIPDWETLSELQRIIKDKYGDECS